jgi:hypothetical protein
MSRCKAPEILRSIKPWAAPAVKFLSEDGPNVLCTSATTLARRRTRETMQMGVFQQPAKTGDTRVQRHRVVSVGGSIEIGSYQSECWWGLFVCLKEV